MTCPSLESWLEAIDMAHGPPDGVHRGCAECQANEAQARELLLGLRAAAPVSPVAGEAFVRGVLRRAHDPRRRLALVAGGLAAAAGFVLALRAGRPVETDAAPVARGQGGGERALCEVARVTSGGLQFLRDGDAVPEGASLAFRVRNPGPETRWIGIFAVTAAARVAWYHPAFEGPMDDPVTLPLSASRESRMLGQSVALPLGKGAVKLVCWQAAHPWRVREADALVERAVSEQANPEALSRVEALGGEQKGISLWFGSRP